MGTMTVIWWRDIPAQVTAREGRKQSKIVLHPRFQVAIDKAASRAGKRAYNDYIEEWRRTGTLNVFHYGFGRVMPVGFELYEDAQRYDSFHANVPMPVQVFQGRRDTAVSPATVEEWSAARPNVELHLLDDDHQLTASLPYTWKEMARFLSVASR